MSERREANENVLGIACGIPADISYQLLVSVSVSRITTGINKISN